jgi:hypothetical protein
MGNRRGERGKGSVGCVIWLAIVVLVGYALVKIVPVKIAASHFEDFMTEEAGFGSIKSTQQIQKEILAKAKELDIPVTKDNLSVTRSREMLTVEAHYQMEIDFFGGAYKYVWKFDPVIQRPTFAV